MNTVECAVYVLFTTCYGENVISVNTQAIHKYIEQINKLCIYCSYVAPSCERIGIVPQFI